jgi:hypothetical protein
MTVLSSVAVQNDIAKLSLRLVAFYIRHHLICYIMGDFVTSKKTRSPE